MRSETRAVGFAALLAGLVPVMLLRSGEVAGQTAPQTVTTDTPEYCLHLRDMVTRMEQVTPAGPASAVASLSSEGQRMCDEGQVRGGILRLRRAIVMMEAAPSQP